MLENNGPKSYDKEAEHSKTVKNHSQWGYVSTISLSYAV